MKYIFLVIFFLSNTFYSQLIKKRDLSNKSDDSLIIDKGQKEAASSLGLTYRETMKSIILPQAIRNVLPALGNEFITLLKETSVAGYIGIVDLVKAADIIASGTYNYFFPLIIIAIIYLILTIGLSKLLTIFEKKVLNHARG